MAGWVEKRGENKWRLNVQGGTDAEGKRKVYRKTIEASSRREAEKKLAEFVAEVQKRQYIEPSKLTFAEFVGHWLKNYAEENLAPKTLHRYREMLETRILPAMGHLKLEEIKPLHLLEFYQNLQEDGIREDGKPGGLSARTILHHHRLIAAILQAAVVDRKIELTLDRQIKLTHLVIKSPLRGGGKRGGQHVQMAAHQGTARSRGRHQANSKGCWGVQEYRQEVP